MTLPLTPRVVRGTGVPAANKIVWGENCTGVRHFDCISFINYVLSETTMIPDSKNGWSGDIKQWSRMWTTDVPLTDPAVAGDILIRYYDDEKAATSVTSLSLMTTTLSFKRRKPPRASTPRSATFLIRKSGKSAAAC